VVIVAYDRPAYLGLLLESLAAQRDAAPFDVVVVDNGSSPPLAESVQVHLERLGPGARIVREPSNRLSPDRWQRALDATSATMILVPGDDDVAEPGYVATMQRLATAGVALVSGGVREIDADGRFLGIGASPSTFPSQPVALARLLTSNGYWMPASGFHRDAVDLSQAPLVRSTFDWWLWMQCWLTGPAAVTSDPVIRYRRHSGQHANYYPSQTFALDAVRMLLSVLDSDRFRAVVAGWTREEADMFADTILAGPGPIVGDARWGTLVQVVAAERLVGRASPPHVAELHAQAAAQAGSPASSGELRLLAPEGVGLPPATWSRVPITATWPADCALAQQWAAYLAIPSSGRAEVVITATCACGRGRAHLLRIEGLRPDGTGEFRLTLQGPPSDSASGPLLDAIGTMTGRPHGFAPIASIEARIIDAVRRLRGGRLGRSLTRAVERSRHGTP
jgi:glycosyltransferase involved in cell wall biosynthesis